MKKRKDNLASVIKSMMKRQRLSQRQRLAADLTDHYRLARKSAQDIFRLTADGESL